MSEPPPVAAIDGLSHRYNGIAALEQITLEIPAGRLVGLIGPDGVGKSSLLGIVGGARQIQVGDVLVLDGDMRLERHRAAVCPRIAYMPQGLGRNLYPDLSVRENIEFFARLFGQARAEREARIADLLRSTGLAKFPDRLAKQLSGGMRQKLGLCCALIHDPDFLILDEPTTGVDPLSRRQFWDLIARMRQRRPGMSVLVATAYMEEAERFDWLIAMNAGRLLATGTPAELKARSGASTLEEAFIALLPEAVRAGAKPPRVPPLVGMRDIAAIEAIGLTRRFGDFTAVDGVGFTIARGEIFGFVGSNGCGKTTTMKMITGLLEPDAGEARLFGRPMHAADMSLRRRVGYMSQSFSLYAELTVRQNLDLHARLFGVSRPHARARIAELIGRFGLDEFVDQPAQRLPLGIRQRLSLAVAVVHEPELLVLDEPTSGVDPLARDRFWELIVDLARNQGVTVFVSTHFMNEAARCDRLSLMHAGRVLATGTPAELAASQGGESLEEAFIGYLRAAAGDGGAEVMQDAWAPGTPVATMPTEPAAFSIRRLLAYSIREALELTRDRVRLTFALLGTALLMLIFGFGINSDVDHVSFAVLDRDQTPESRAYLEEVRGSDTFIERAPVVDPAELEQRLKRGEIKFAIEVPSGFGRDLRRARPTEVGVWIDGAMPFRAETIRGYLKGMHQLFLADLATAQGQAASVLPPATIETRFRYNQTFESINSMVPSTIALLLALIPAILMALAVVREKELGSITNLYVTPVTRLEFLLGKQLPYIAVGMVNLACMLLMAELVFGVPLKGSLLTLALATLVYVSATTGYGLVISAFAPTQIAALIGTAIMTFMPAMQASGMFEPVSSLSGVPAVMSWTFPMAYFLPISVGTFTKALGFAELGANILALAVFVPVLMLATVLLMRRQER